ncbi:MAG: transposase, partial [Elusimicrobiota bacterium]
MYNLILAVGGHSFHAIYERYKKRWIIERTIGWLQYFRRLVVRYERSD